MKKKNILRIFILVALLAAAGWAGYAYGLPALSRLQAGAQSPTAAAPAAYQTARVRRAGDETGGTITTSGAVRSRQTAVLLWQTSGTVSRVTAATGQEVETGTVLAELEQTSLPQAVILARAELVSAQKALDTLLQSTQARAAAQMALVKAQKELDDAQDDRRSKLYQRASAETIDIARARLIEANEALDQAESFFDSHSADTSSLVYATALSQLARARQNQIQAQYNLDYVTGLPEPLDIEEADARIAVAEANVLQARLDWDRVKDGPNAEDVAAAEARVAAAQATLNLARIAAPFAGTLTLVNCKDGDQVTPGIAAFQLDDLSHLYLDAAVVEDEIERVQVGQPVTLGFDALPGAEYPGVVTEVAAFGKSTAGTVNFNVTVEILSPGEKIKPGMTASVSITTGQVTGALLVPTRAVYERQGKRVVYVLRNGQPEPVEVTAADAGDAVTSITAGALEAGDLVVLDLTGAPALAEMPPVPLPGPEAAAPTAPSPTLEVAEPEPAAQEDDPAVIAAREYFLALEEGDFEAAANLYSDFSLMVAGITRGEAALELQGQMSRGSRWSGLEVIETRVVADRTVLVRVAYQIEGAHDAGPAQMDEWWPVREENGRWLVNRGNLIDYRVLDVTEQATGGLVVKPLRLTRFTDRMRLSLMVQNTTNEAIVLGQVNEILALFSFGDQQVEAVKEQMIFDRLRTNPQVEIDVLGSFDTYPDGVIIRQWKNYTVKPWFTFSFTD